MGPFRFKRACPYASVLSYMYGRVCTSYALSPVYPKVDRQTQKPVCRHGGTLNSKVKNTQNSLEISVYGIWLHSVLYMHI